MTQPVVDPNSFRRALGSFCTGVTVVATVDGDEPVGFACQSFAALSLDPPLVLFCPGKSSRTWPRIEASGVFCVNVLSHEQRDISSLFGTSGADKFASLAWHPAPSGSPIINGVLSWIDCTIEAVHDAGDHYVVVGRVQALDEPASSQRPLLFYRGAYTATEAAEPTPGVLDNLITWSSNWSRDDDWI